MGANAALLAQVHEQKDLIEDLRKELQDQKTVIKLLVELVPRQRLVEQLGANAADGLLNAYKADTEDTK
ncbi:hypothetical protein JCM10207_002704 [Rhodosporidiobolus poonsookiae]